MHAKNIVHRDLKLENILVDERGYLTIIDFGISKRLDNKELNTETVCGTPLNMAPELLEGYKYNKSVDLWSIGIIIYEMLIGKNPFNLAGEDLSPNEFLEMIQETEITFPHTDVDVRYSDEVKSFIM